MEWGPRAPAGPGRLYLAEVAAGGSRQALGPPDCERARRNYVPTVHKPAWRYIHALRAYGVPINYLAGRQAGWLANARGAGASALWQVCTRCVIACEVLRSTPRGIMEQGRSRTAARKGQPASALRFSLYVCLSLVPDISAWPGVVVSWLAGSALRSSPPPNFNPGCGALQRANPPAARHFVRATTPNTLKRSGGPSAPLPAPPAAAPPSPPPHPDCDAKAANPTSDHDRARDPVSRRGGQTDRQPAFHVVAWKQAT